MQTLRKRTSPCKYKNDPSRFLGEGITFKAKLIGILEVSEARGDKMCQDALNDLKTAIRAAGEHKQRITISISIDGLRLRDEKTGDCLYHHPVHKISFIAQDMSDSRAFGYIFGSPDTGHRFFGIKTDKTASQVVISMRDLFQVVFELKKKEIEMAKHHSEQHHSKYSSSGHVDSIHFAKDESELDKVKGKYSHLLKSRCLTSRDTSGSSDLKGATSEAIADLLDLEHELNSIQQGINQMDKITPSDPFGPLSKGDSYDPFEDSFSSKPDKGAEESISSGVMTQHQSEDSSDVEKHGSFFGSGSSTGKFFSQFSPGMGKPKMDDGRWFDQESESLFDESVNVNNAEPTSSPIALNTPGPDSEQVHAEAEGRKSPVKTDLFTELDPLGTGRVKPYVDKKDFFQELKNPPKKVLKEMISDVTSSELTTLYFPAHFKDEKGAGTAKQEDRSSAADSAQSFGESAAGAKYSRIDPFEDGDPFEKTDPFEEEQFLPSAEFTSMFARKPSLDGIFDEKISWKFDKSKDPKEEKQSRGSPKSFPLFPSGALRVTLPPEKVETSPLTISAITSKLRSSPNSPDDLKNVRRKCYQALHQSTVEASEDSPVHEEPFVKRKISGFEAKTEQPEKKSPFKDRFHSVNSVSLSKTEKTLSKPYASVEMLDASTPDPPPRAKAALFSIKPPPLPPKKPNQPVFRPPARPPSLEGHVPHYDYLQRKETSNTFQCRDDVKCIKLKSQLFADKELSPSNEPKKRNPDASFPVLPPPPQRKCSGESGSKTNYPSKVQDDRGQVTTINDGSVLNIKLAQLDNTGLENLALTLGIPSENMYSMTLQDLTKMLAEKYLTSQKEEQTNDTRAHGTFEADFDANFAKPEVNDPKSTYDKYAVFKELIESDSKSTKLFEADGQKESGESTSGTKDNSKETVEQEEDRYAALRQLSLSTPKPDNLSGEDDENSSKVETSSEPRPRGEPTLSTVNESDPVGNESQEQGQSAEKKGEAEGKSDWESTQDWCNVPVAEGAKDFTGDGHLFPLVDQFSDEKRPQTSRENWATFEKSDFQETFDKKRGDDFIENENSPFSSDGKEEVRGVPFRWHRNLLRKKNEKDVPWQDDDESWDDYSPKESFCSDESSREDRSPESRREDCYEQPSWNARGRPSKEKIWHEKSDEWSRREKWQEETEDEFEDTWRKPRERTGSCDSDRPKYWHGGGYGGYNKRYEWCNSRGEPWQESDRHSRCYGNRRKRSESDNEYRKRCDSDASDKECAWTFQKNYSDTYGRSGKPKQHHGCHTFRDCSEHCHESRSKHRKGISQKRPNSASESKRSHEKSCSSTDCSFRSGDKAYPAKREMEKDECPRYQHMCKDSRHRNDVECVHYHGYDRKLPSHHPKSSSRSARGFSAAPQNDAFQSPNKRSESSDSKSREFAYFEAFAENNYGYTKVESANHFNFESESENFENKKQTSSEQSLRHFSKSPDSRVNHWASTNGKTDPTEGFYSTRTNNHHFQNFKQDFRASQMESNGKPEAASEDPDKSQGKSKNQIARATRQESTTMLRKSDSINIFSRDKDPFEGDDFFNNVS